ncbi:MAG: DUF4231 domain-containing protein [Deltaproteobacteria bacterium]|nr:DUF4231 domain-containing protein [Deltaproteobacteria bacterium]
MRLVTPKGSPVDAFDVEYRHYLATANRNRFSHHVAQVCYYSLAVSVPIVLLLDHEQANVIGAVISAVTTLIVSLERHFKFKENWLIYFQIAEDLRREKSLYSAGAGDYKRTEDAQSRFVERVEQIKRADLRRLEALNSQGDDVSKQRASRS